MNSIVTYTARAKLLSLNKRIPGPVLIDKMGSRLTLQLGADSEITQSTSSAIIVNMQPLIYATPQAAASLMASSIDFDYASLNFVLTAG